MKIGRHTQILEIVSEQEIETQDELASQLRLRGFDVTQATVPRDIKELRLIKIPSEKTCTITNRQPESTSIITCTIYRKISSQINIIIHYKI